MKRFMALALLCVFLGATGSACVVIKHVPPGQIKKHSAPGQMKKR